MLLQNMSLILSQTKTKMALISKHNQIQCLKKLVDFSHLTQLSTQSNHKMGCHNFTTNPNSGNETGKMFYKPNFFYPNTTYKSSMLSKKIYIKSRQIRSQVYNQDPFKDNFSRRDKLLQIDWSLLGQ